MPEVTYRYFRNPKLEAQLRKELTPYLRILPAWCDRVFVNKFTRPSDDVTCSVKLAIAMNPPYRFCEIFVYSAFFGQTEQHRKQAILHELIHAMTGAPLEWVKDHVLPFVEKHNPDLAVYLRNEFRDKVEEMTESLAYTLARELGEEIPHHGQDSEEAK